MITTTVKEETFDSLKAYRNDPSSGLNWSSVFVLPGFMESWWQIFREKDSCLFIRSIWQDEKLIGIAPLLLNGANVSFIGHKDVFDYIDFVTVPGKEADFFNILVGYLKENGVSRLDIGPVRPDASVMQVLVPMAKERGFDVSTVQEDVFVELPLPPTWEAYLDELGGKERHEMRRKIRRLEGAGHVDFRIVKDAESISAVENTFFQLFPSSPGEKGKFMVETMSRFFHTLIKAMTEAGVMRFGVLSLDGNNMAMVMCFDYEGTVYLYNSVYDPDQSALSPGVLCKAFYIRGGIEQGQKIFDFLKGSETYKYRMGGRETPIYRCHIGIK